MNLGVAASQQSAAMLKRERLRRSAETPLRFMASMRVHCWRSKLPMNRKVATLISNDLRLSGSWGVSRSERNRELSLNRRLAPWSLDCAGRAKRRRRFRAREKGSRRQPSGCVRKRCRAALATAVQDALGWATVHGPKARPLLEVEAFPGSRLRLRCPPHPKRARLRCFNRVGCGRLGSRSRPLT